MNAVRIHKNGGPEVLSYDEKVEVPTPNSKSVLVGVAYSGINYIDTYHRTGLYKLNLPAILGREGAGVVVSLGSEVKNVKVGDRVAFLSAGTYGEYVTVDESSILPLPSNMSLLHGCACLLQGLTAHFLTTSTFAVNSNTDVMVHAGAGGTGQLIIQMCKLKGARVITTVGSKEKVSMAKSAGADEVILYSDEKVDVVKEVKKFTNQIGVHVVYDGVGKNTYQQSLQCLKRRGHLVLFGNASGKVPPIDPLDLCNAGSITLTRPTLNDHVQADELHQRAKDLFSWISQGKVKISAYKTFPLKEAAEAHKYLEGRLSVGKILLAINEKLE